MSRARSVCCTTAAYAIVYAYLVVDRGTKGTGRYVYGARHGIHLWASPRGMGHALVGACLGWHRRGCRVDESSDLNVGERRDAFRATFRGDGRVMLIIAQRRLPPCAHGARRGIHLWRHPEGSARSHKGVPRVASSRPTWRRVVGLTFWRTTRCVSGNVPRQGHVVPGSVGYDTAAFAAVCSRGAMWHPPLASAGGMGKPLRKAYPPAVTFVAFLASYIGAGSVDSHVGRADPGTPT